MLWAKPDALPRRSYPQVALDKCVAESRDADQQAGNLSNWLQEYDQLGEGEFYGRVEELTFDRLQVFSEHTSKALRQQCNVWPNALWLGIPANDAECRINGLPVTGNTIMCRPGNRDFELVTPEAFDILGIVVDQDLLHRAADIQDVALPARRLDQPRLTLPAGTLKQLRYVLTRLIGADRPLATRKHAQDLVMMALLQVLQQERPTPQPLPSYAHRKAVVDRVKGYLAEQDNAPVTMTQLCELAHVSRRTLQYSFETILGISPLRFLRATRLNRVRRALADAGYGHGHGYRRTVTEVSAEWGFWHAGQFARDYRQLFGESPSDTLRRSQQSN